MDTNQIIAAVVVRLKEKVPNLAVDDWPEKPESYRLNHPVGALLVTYMGSQFAAPRDLTFVTQDVTFNFIVVAKIRQLNGRDGVLATQDAVRKALVGFKPPNCHRKTWATSEDIPDEENGIWQGQTHFSTMTTQIEAEEGEDGPPMKPPSFKDES